jgi:hypothetical protein
MPVNDGDDWYNINIYSTIYLFNQHIITISYNINANERQDKKRTNFHNHDTLKKKKNIFQAQRT